MSLSTNLISKKKSEIVPPEFLELAKNPDSTTHKAVQMGFKDQNFVSWRWQMRNQIKSADEAAKFYNLGEMESKGFKTLKDLFDVGVTPYYAAISRNPLDESCPIRVQGIPNANETSDLLGQKDPLFEVDHSPVKEVVHVYPDRVAFCVAQLCPVYCRYCFRKRRDEEDGLHFNKRIIDEGIKYIKSQKSIRDVLITGGDPFIASDSAIENLLSRLREIPHVEVIRFGTRTPVTLPYRVTKKLAKIISKYHPVWLNTHFNCAEEITIEAQLALKNLVDAGIPVGNQAVLLKGINDSSKKMMDLCVQLIKNRVRPYYVFHAHLIAGTEHLRVPVNRGLEIMKSLRGNLSGFGIPTYALDTPSGKIPIIKNHILGVDGTDLLLEDIRGEIWREPDAWKTDY